MKIELHSIPIRDVVDGYADRDEDGVVAYHGRLVCRPPYQRNFIYDDRQASAVIRTVMHGFPLNTMYWVKQDQPDPDGQPVFEILDGQQRTLSICRYVQRQQADGSWTPAEVFVDDRAWMNLLPDERERFLDYKLQVYVCEGTDSEKLDWFRTINIAGEALTDQELLNAVYAGEWLTAVKRRFSKTGCAALNVASMQGRPMISGRPIRQDLLKTVLAWYADSLTLERKGRGLTGKAATVTPENVMASHQALHPGDDDWDDLWDYWTTVYTWVKGLFTVYRDEMKTVPWGLLYNRHHTQQYAPAELESEIARLMADDEVTRKPGVYPYVLGEPERVLSLRQFSKADKRAAFERQKGVCPICGRRFDNVELGEADHITPWSEGGRTTPDNMQWLCKACNRAKSDD